MQRGEEKGKGTAIVRLHASTLRGKSGEPVTRVIRGESGISGACNARATKICSYRLAGGASGTGKADPEGASFAWCACHTDSAFVLFDDRLGDRQSQPRTALLLCV